MNFHFSYVEYTVIIESHDLTLSLTYYSSQFVQYGLGTC